MATSPKAPTKSKTKSKATGKAKAPASTASKSAARSSKTRDAWLESKRGRLALSATGIAVGAAAAMLAVFAAPLTPVALAIAGLGLASGAAVPGAEWLLDWRDGKKTVQENGLHYLLSL